VLTFLVLLTDAPLTFREFMSREEVPLADLFRASLEFLATRDDAVLFGAQAVNAYCDPPRMTADLDVLSLDAEALAEALRASLAERFRIATRVRALEAGQSYRVYQVRQPRNRHLADVRHVDALPEWRDFAGVRVAAPAALVALKVLSLDARRGKEKGLSDRLDLHRLLRAFPTLRTEEGEVADRLRAAGAPRTALSAWREILAERIEPDEDDLER
jgi:hypothetical protein